MIETDRQINRQDKQHAIYHRGTDTSYSESYKSRPVTLQPARICTNLARNKQHCHGIRMKQEGVTHKKYIFSA